MMKTMKAMLLALTLILALPLVLAETNPEVITETNPDISAEELIPFKHSFGAEVRLLQLERSVHSNIIQGEQILEILKQENASQEKIDELEATIGGMIELKEEIKEYELQGQEENINAFIEFREEARELTRLFREEAQEQINEEDRANIRARIMQNARDSETVRGYGEIISQKARQHNEEVVRETTNKTGILSEDLLNRIRNQEIEPQQIREEITTRIREQTQNASENFNELKENAMRQRINTQDIREQTRVSAEEQIENAKNRIQNIKDKVPQENITEQIQQINEVARGRAR